VSFLNTTAKLTEPNPAYAMGSNPLHHFYILSTATREENLYPVSSFEMTSMGPPVMRYTDIDTSNDKIYWHEGLLGF
jgi:hypothetical protein